MRGLPCGSTGRQMGAAQTHCPKGSSDLLGTFGINSYLRTVPQLMDGCCQPSALALFAKTPPAVTTRRMAGTGSSA